MIGTRTLLDGIILGESPRWHDDLLWFCDWGAHEIRAVGLDGSSQVVGHVSALPFCIDWQPDGRMLVVAGRDRMLLRAVRGCGGALSLEPYVDLARLCDRPWNEIVVDGRGNAYLNCPGYDMAGGPPGSGIIALVTHEGNLRQVADGVFFPNGMAVTPDGCTLLVAESDAGRITAFGIKADGGLSGRRVWAELGDDSPHGICVDADGAVWYADVLNKRCVRMREGGTVLNVIALDRACFSCVLGGTDGSTLFMTAAVWTGAAASGEAAAPTGVLLTAEAPAPGAGPGFQAAD